MKPNRFIANSDYLALAQTSKNTGSINFPQTNHDVRKTFPTYKLYEPVVRIIKDINIPAVKGAIEQVQITYGNTTYAGNELLNPVSSNEEWIIQVARINATTVRATLGHWTDLIVGNTPPKSPKVNFDISIVTFRPPNTT